MEIDPRLKKLCLLLLDVDGTPVLTRAMRVAIVALLHAQAKCIREQDIPVLTQVIEFGPNVEVPTHLRHMVSEREQQTTVKSTI